MDNEVIAFVEVVTRERIVHRQLSHLVFKRELQFLGQVPALEVVLLLQLLCLLRKLARLARLARLVLLALRKETHIEQRKS